MKKKISLFLCFLLAAAVANATVDRDLILAVAKGRFKRVQELVEKKKANVNATYDKGKTSLHWAVISGDLKMVAYLIAKGAKLEARDDYGDTPFHKAAFRQTDDLDILKYLIMKGADINAKNRYGWTPLHYFSYYDNSLAVKFLIMQEAELTNQTRAKYMEITNGLTAYDIAVQKHWTNVMTSLENPDRYRHLSNTPYLMMSLSNDIGPENTLTGPRTARLFIRVENRGGAFAPNVSVSVDAPSNVSGILVGRTDGFSLGIGAVRDLVVPVEATREVRDGLVELRIMVRESAFNKESGPAMFRFRTQSPRPPVLFISNLAVLTTNRVPVLNGLEKLKLTWLLEDRVSNSGYADNVYFRVLAVSNCEQVRFAELSNITLAPGEKKTVTLEIEGGENLKDGLAKIKAVATDLPFKVGVTNHLVIEKKHLLRPVLDADVFYRVNLITNIVTNARRIYDYKNYYSYTNNTDSNAVVTNYWTVTNMTLTNDILTVMDTNRESGVILKNLGEGPARNITLGIQAILLPGGTNTNETRSGVTLYNIPEIGTNMMRILPFLNYIRSDHPFNILNVKWSDDRKLSVVETNFTVEVK